MKILIAENSGFCFGVSKAINTTIKEITNSNNQIYSLGPLIHNLQETKRLEDLGLKVIDKVSDGKDSKVIIRSHGVPLEIYEQAKENSIELIDSTCPFVRKIQKKAKKFYEDGYQIVIIGSPNHPEVIGINGWCNNKAVIINCKDDIEDMSEYDKICIVAQTTLTQDKFKELSELVALKGNYVEIFNTICNATKQRQSACEKVAKESDAMIVIGGYHSSNTQKLVEISKKYCDNTYHIETVDELPTKVLSQFETIGITAGASTPEWIIKEVISKMSENSMNDMLEAIENSMVDLNRGDVVEGEVISVNDTEVMVNIGYKSDGIIKRSELSNDPNVQPTEIVKSGDKISVFIIKLDDGEGNVLLSKRRVDDIKHWEELEEIFNEEKVVSTKIIEAVNGGLIALVNGIRGFMPASHVAVKYVDDLNEYLGQEMDVKIIEFNSEKNRVILSRKVIEKEEVAAKREKLWETLEKGAEIEGVVKRLTNFGAFVDIGGVDGLIHISDLSWGRIKHPSEVVKEEDKVKVVVLDFDKGNGKISLGLKQTIKHPWDDINSKYSEGDIVEGKVVNLVDFGAFVELEPGLDGLVHISQISNEHIAKPSDKLEAGQKVMVKIIEIKEDEKRLSLSIKEAENKEAEPVKEEKAESKDEQDVTIGDIIKSQDEE
ncbi:bifunctional 4-hydroxy-3-methylbut-2-enyl diphosphate reductase/30S ribosomal protein S1 [Sporosalibacterium faouarense]|uniref:bifunctional 4-hydroxy-3-methylbut-2-enyl diphosphate reductase/30S ribosomal protein S1 n=1 Tax=Sporosalibacterium faouarense TaxID=516123 RepID=UPI00141C56AB|nr:bifunctional 4-hydroxy-3-methylbut-2-enyl diphosphate reductase/30S ribosomal protein S1 [Sporosalibacterium faouarense]MTI48145.1 bifunctional 4-hydroxy-3-methylbut-2-enyl diphosphate reductase/30S ribosomal protein S1 [Bacillota bacterium]